MGFNNQKPQKTKSDILVAVAALQDDDPRLAATAAALAGEKQIEESVSLRLYRMGEAAEVTGRSRCTLWRAIKAGRIKTVQLREGGAHLIPEVELRKLAGLS